jgi:hypothetical protein
LAGAADPLQVWNVAPSSHDDELAPPGEPGSSLYSAVDICISVPVTGDEIHIRANHDMTVVDFNPAGSIQSLLDINESRVGECLGVRDEGVQPNDLLAVAQGLVVISFDTASCLFGCERLGGQEMKICAPCVQRVSCE